MTRLRDYRHLLSSFVVGVLLALREDVADAIFDDDDAEFQYGDACEKLQDLSGPALDDLLDALSGQTFVGFCRVEDPVDCADLSDALDERAVLMPSREPGGCDLVPSRRVPDVDPYKNYGSTHKRSQPLY